MTFIPDVPTLHERVDWEENGYRMALDFTRTPPAYPTNQITQPVAHYTGAMNVPDGDAGENPDSIAAWLRRSQRDYLENRTGGGYTRKSDGRYFPGYPLGYHFGIDWLGGAWTLRGFDFLSAATNQHNGYTIAFLFFVDGPDKANDLMWATARAIAREARRRSGRADFATNFTDHGSLYLNTGQGTPTACAGAGIRSQLTTQGRIDLAPPPQPPPPGGSMIADKTLLKDYRLYDSREHDGKLLGERQHGITDGDAQGAIGLVANVTVVDTEAPVPQQFLSAWPTGAFPGTSKVNWDRPGQTVANEITIPLSSFGTFRVKTSAPTNYFIDVVGYLLP